MVKEKAGSFQYALHKWGRLSEHEAEREPDPTMSAASPFSSTQEALVDAYMQERRGKHKPLDRVVTEPSGLTPEEMMSVLRHPVLEDRA